MHSHAIDLMYRATSSTPRMLPLLVCYIIFDVFLSSYQLDTWPLVYHVLNKYKEHPSSSFHHHHPAITINNQPTSLQRFYYLPMMLLTSDFFPFFGTSLYASFVGVSLSSHHRHHRGTKIQSRLGDGKGLRCWSQGAGPRVEWRMPRWLGGKMYKLRYGKK